MNDDRKMLLAVLGFGIVCVFAGAGITVGANRPAAPAPKPDLRTVVDQQVIEIKSLRAQVERLEDRVAALEAKLGVNGQTPERQAIKKAATSGKLAKGMTVDEVTGVIGAKPTSRSESSDGLTLMWEFREGMVAGAYNPGTGGSTGGSRGYIARRVTAWFGEDGKLERFEDDKLH